MDSQPIEDFVLQKVHSKTWVSNVSKAIRNKVKFESTLSFVDSTGEKQTLTVVPSLELCKEYQPCVGVDDDEHIMQLNEFSSKIKVTTQDKIDIRIAKSTQHQVTLSRCPYRVFTTHSAHSHGYRRSHGLPRTTSCVSTKLR
jgi:hypothetical protein